MIKKLAFNLDRQTVFSFSEIAQITGKLPDQNLVSAVSYYVKKGDLIRVAKGFYVLNRNYSRWELGNKLRIPSYVSLYTVLKEEGMVFQPYTSIFLVSARSQTLKVEGQVFIYRKIKNEILLSNLGITVQNNAFTAESERALLDKIYLNGDEYFDNLSKIDWNKARFLNKEMYKSSKIEKYIKTMRNYA